MRKAVFFVLLGFCALFANAGMHADKSVYFELRLQVNDTETLQLEKISVENWSPRDSVLDPEDGYALTLRDSEGNALSTRRFDTYVAAFYDFLPENESDNATGGVIIPTDAVVPVELPYYDEAYSAELVSPEGNRIFLEPLQKFCPLDSLDACKTKEATATPTISKMVEEKAVERKEPTRPSYVPIAFLLVLVGIVVFYMIRSKRA